MTTKEELYEEETSMLNDIRKRSNWVGGVWMFFVALLPALTWLIDMPFQTIVMWQLTLIGIAVFHWGSQILNVVVHIGVDRAIYKRYKED